MINLRLKVSAREVGAEKQLTKLSYDKVVNLICASEKKFLVSKELIDLVVMR